MSELNIDFTHIRGVLYKYNEDSKNQLLADRHMATLFRNFFLHGKEDLMSKARDKSLSYASALEQELHYLYEEAQ